MKDYRGIDLKNPPVDIPLKQLHYFQSLLETMKVYCKVSPLLTYPNKQ